MKDFFKYVGAGVVGTLILGLFLGLLAAAPILPAALATVFMGISCVAIILFPGACVFYGLAAWRKGKKTSTDD